MKMRNLLFGVILGLFAFVHSTPVDTETKDNIYHEVMTDGYLIDNYTTTSHTTQLPTRNATVQEPQWPSSKSEDTDVIEDRHLGDSYATQIPLPDDDQSRESDISEDTDLGDFNYNSMTTVASQQEKEHFAITIPGDSNPHSSPSTELSKGTSGPDPTQTSQSHFTSSSMPNEVMTTISPDSILDFQTIDPSFIADDFWSLTGLEEEEIHQQYPTESPRMTSVSNTETTTESSTFPTALKTNSIMFEESEGSGFGFEQEETRTESSTIMTTTTMFKEYEGSGFGFEQETGTHTTPKMIAENHQPQDESRTESSTFTTAFEKFPRMFEEVEESGSGFGFVKENQPQEETTTASNSMTTRHIAPRIINGLGSGFKQVPDVTEPVLTSESVESKVNQFAAGPGLGKEPETVRPPAHQNAGHSTPGWIIIVGFIVGVAALVMVCVAIATRDKWNKSKSQPKIETKINTTNQQRELEMETFLHKDHPTENGKAAEYTVIPLDELPEKYSSH